MLDHVSQSGEGTPESERQDAKRDLINHRSATKRGAQPGLQRLLKDNPNKMPQGNTKPDQSAAEDKRQEAKCDLIDQVSRLDQFDRRADGVLDEYASC